DLAIFYQIISALVTINTVIAFITVFRRPRSITSVIAWMMTLVFLPGIGFILYAFCGRGIDGETVYLLSEKHQRRIKEINEIIEKNNHSFPERMVNEETYLLEDYLQGMDESPITLGNQLTFFTDGKEKFNHLFEDIRKAEDNVHVEYYAFFDDRIGNKFLDVLVEKSQEGVEVRLIFDPWGGKT